ncbi:MAG: H4MPT-linked C1 transfer pathway protein [Methanomicrobiales archaeon HGW-Methanomicrobiales-4]|nr:MAG: H4MPT-linked C1 transfer pathway protein [Methanomicrobiales archaeon HGW-Methanomicrobiales-4]
MRDLLAPYEADQDVAVVMSGELADCFSSKSEGISFIVSQVKDVFPKAHFYGTDSRFHTRATPELAAANWLAMADLLREKYPNSLLVDMGSTTTDIIPLNRFDLMRGQTDLTRLQQGYLVYCGFLRTHVATLIPSAVVNGCDTPVSTEYFASTGDAYVALGRIPESLFTADTADRKGTDRISCLRRLSRVVCADLEEIGEEGACDIARTVVQVQEKLITTAIRKVAGQNSTENTIVAGIGSGIVSRWIGGVSLTESLGEYADALPAYAVRKIFGRIR